MPHEQIEDSYTSIQIITVDAGDDGAPDDGHGTNFVGIAGVALRGTGFACASAAGQAGLLLSQNPEMTAAELKEKLEAKHNELRRLDEAEESCGELARMLKIVEAERDRYKAALIKIYDISDEYEAAAFHMSLVAKEALAEAVRP